MNTTKLSQGLFWLGLSCSLCLLWFYQPSLPSDVLAKRAPVATTPWTLDVAVAECAATTQSATCADEIRRENQTTATRGRWSVTDLQNPFVVFVFYVTAFALLLSQSFPKTVGIAVSFALGVVGDLTTRALRSIRAIAGVVIVSTAAVSGAGLGIIAYLIIVSVYAGYHDVSIFIVFFVMVGLVAIDNQILMGAARALIKTHAANEGLPSTYALFLRAFDSDGAIDDPMMGGLGLRQFSEEEELTELFVPSMPVVAFQSSRFGIPYFGSTRFQLTNNWKPTVRRAIEGAALVIVRVGATQGVSWEIQQIIDAGALPRTLFVLPRGRSKRFYKDSNNLLHIVDPVYGTFTVPRATRTKSARVVYLNKAGELAVGHEPSGWLVGLVSRLLGYRLRSMRRVIAPYLEIHGLRIPRHVSIADATRQLVYLGCLGWLLWLRAGR